MTDKAVLTRAVEDVDVVIHCAAKVGDWGPVEEYRKVNVEGLRTLLDACKGHALARFVHMSSLGVYAARHHYGTDESEPLPQPPCRRLHAVQGRGGAARPAVTTATGAFPWWCCGRASCTARATAPSCRG